MHITCYLGEGWLLLQTSTFQIQMGLQSWASSKSRFWFKNELSKLTLRLVYFTEKPPHNSRSPVVQSVTGNWTDGGQISKVTQCCTNMVQQRRPGEMNPQRTPEYFHHLPHLLFHKHSLPQPNILSLHPFLFFLNKNVSKLSLSTIVSVNLSSPNILKRIVATIIFLGCKESAIIKPCSWPGWVFSVF